MSENEKNFSFGTQASRRDFLKTSALGPLLPILAPRAAPPAPSGRRTELQTGWRMSSARNVSGADEEVSKPSFDVSNWYTIRRMPATVFETLAENGVYKDPYVGMNLTENVPADLWKQ